MDISNLEKISIKDLNKLKSEVLKEINFKISKELEHVDPRLYIIKLATEVKKDQKAVKDNKKLYDFLLETKTSELRFFENQVYFPYGGINYCGEFSRGEIYNRNKKPFNCEYLLSFTDVFDDLNTIYLYHGTYTLYHFLLDYLKEIIKDKTKNPYKKVFKDFNTKRKIVEKDFTDIAKALYEYREEQPGSKIAIANNIISKYINKKEDSEFTIPQRDFIDTIAFCTPLKELENKDYTRLKKLVFYPLKELDTKKNITKLINSINVPVKEVKKVTVKKEYNKEALDLFLKQTKTKDIFFLSYQLSYPSTETNFKNVAINEYYFLKNDEKISLILKNNKIDGINRLRNAEIYYHASNKHKELFENEEFVEALNKACSLDTIDKFLKDKDNALNYQGINTIYKYFIEYLKLVLVGNIDNPKAVIEKDLDLKKKIVVRDIREIATTLYTLKKENPGSLLAVANNCIGSCMKGNTYLTPNKRRFIETIAYCSTLEELENRDYTRLKKLVFEPIRNDL